MTEMRKYIQSVIRCMEQALSHENEVSVKRRIITGFINQMRGANDFAQNAEIISIEIWKYYFAEIEKIQDEYLSKYDYEKENS